MVTFDEDRQQRRLDELRHADEENLVSMLAETQYGVAYVNLGSQTIDNDAIRLLDESDARALDVGPFKLVGKKLTLAVRSPVADGALKAKELLEAKGFEVTFAMASEASIQKVWSRYADLSFATTSRAGSLDITPEVLTDLSKNVKTMDAAAKKITASLTDDSDAHKLSRLLEVILGSGIGLGASDVHIEPMESNAEIRFRLDGLLHVVATISHEVYHKLNSRIKLLSGLKLTINNNPQDGRFSAYLSTGDKPDEINFRTSLIPGAYGESIVLRILNPKSIRVELDGLGISQPMYEIFMREIKKPHGMILLTGPTGSGKTTTLYAFLQKIFTPEIKVITIEDPIEYHLAGITQTQTDHKKGYNFLEGLRSALRQDPDVIMVGEIRDPETAKIAINASLTGHMVYSTLHTNDASGVIPRLIDLDVNPKILVSALTLSIAQRLTRRLCTECKYERPVTDEEKKLIERIWNTAVSNGKPIDQFGVKSDVVNLWSAKGCEYCNNTGYKGRIGIYECIQMDAEIEKIVMQNPTERDIKAIANKQKTLDMREDGLVKILQGVTDFQEVGSVVDLEEEK